MLISELNAYILIGYVVSAAVRSINLTKSEIETEGALYQRGFLGIDPNVKPGYDSIRYTVRIAGDGTAEQFQAIHDTVVRTSLNRFNLAMPVRFGLIP